MDILMVSPELSREARAAFGGHTGDTVFGLSKALAQLEHRVTVAVPRSATLESGGLVFARRLSPLKLSDGSAVTVLDGQLGSGVTLVLFDAPELTDATYGEQLVPGDAERFALFSRAVHALVEQRSERREPYDVVHLHDWPAAPVAASLRRETERPTTVLTLHDIARTGSAPKEVTSAFGLSGLDLSACEEGGSVSLAAIGALSADAVTTQAQAIAADAGEGKRAPALARALAASGAPAVGILRGLDYSVWNPATDSALKSRYDAEAPYNKGSTKTELCRKVGLELDVSRPLIVALLTEDPREAELLRKAAPEILKNPVGLVVASPSADLSGFGRLREERPACFATEVLGDEASLRRAVAAADFVLVPSAYEKTGLWARLGQRYGAVPVVAASGAHVDAVVDSDAGLETGTGFLFDGLGAEALQGAVGRALSAYASPGWGALRRRIMRLDLSWDRTARRYVQLYRQASVGKSRTAS